MFSPHVVILKNGVKVSIAETEPEDAAATIAYLNQVGGESGNLTFGEGDFPLSLEEETEFIRGVREKKRNVFLKAVIDGKIVGTATIMRVERKRVQHIGTLGISVLKSHWAMGVGKALLSSSIELAKMRGMTKINLHVRDDNAGGIALYEKLGFFREGVTTRSLLIDGNYYPSILMGLEL